MKKLFLFSLALLASFSLWATVIDLTPASDVSIDNKKWKEVGGAYVSRNGSSTTVSSTYGVTTGGGNTYIVFDVAEASTIEAKFINHSKNEYADKAVLCGKVSSTQWTSITSAATGNSQYQLSIASEDKLTDGSISFEKNKQDATTSCSFTTTAAGKYAVYWSSSINGNVYLYEIEITAATPSLTGAWMISEEDVTGKSINVVQGTSAPSIPTISVGATTGTPTSSDYNVAYSLKAGSTEGIFTFDEDGISAISTANAGSATIVATLTTADASKYLTPETNTFEYTVNVAVPYAPSFTSPETEPATVYYEQNQTATALSVEATGGPAPSLQWYSNSSKTTEEATAITGETNTTYTPSTATVGDFYYYCVATNTSGSATSHFFHINVTEATCPSGLAISGVSEYFEYDDIELTTSLTSGNGAITYQWYKGGTEDANKIDGAISKDLTISSCALTDAGNYYCIASKAACDDAISEAFAVTINKLPACYSFTPLLESSSALAVGTELSTSVGGKMVVAANSTIKYTAYGLSFESSGTTKVIITLNNKMKVGTIIKAILWSNNTGSARTLKLNNSSSATKATWSFTPSSAEGEEKEFTYTVIASDGLADANTLELQRGSNIYLRSLTITNCGDEVPKTPTSISNTDAAAKAQKRIENGQLVIEKNGKVFNAMGQTIR